MENHYDDLIKDFEHRLAHHDWYFDYSDDHRVWKAGQRASEELTALKYRLEEAGYDAQVHALWKKYCPWAK